MSSASTSKAPNPNSLKLDEQTREQQPQQSQLSGLEEDDEFEEFEAQDWDDSQTVARLGDSATVNASSGSEKPSGDRLWEDNWDDDDLEDEFMKQLRSELAKTGQGTTGVHPVAAGTPEPMQH